MVTLTLESSNKDQNMAKANGDSCHRTIKNNISLTNLRVSMKMTRNMDSVLLYGKWAINTPVIMATMREMGGAPWNGLMAVFTKDSG